MISILPKSAVLSNLLFGGLFHQVLPTDEAKAFVFANGGIALLLPALLFRMTALSLPMLADHRGEAVNADCAVRSAMTSGLPGKKKQPSTLRSSCWMLAQGCAQAFTHRGRYPAMHAGSVRRIRLADSSAEPAAEPIARVVRCASSMQHTPIDVPMSHSSGRQLIRSFDANSLEVL
jgi:hypothetical protein